MNTLMKISHVIFIGPVRNVRETSGLDCGGVVTFKYINFVYVGINCNKLYLIMVKFGHLKKYFYRQKQIFFRKIS